MLMVCLTSKLLSMHMFASLISAKDSKNAAAAHRIDILSYPIFFPRSKSIVLLLNVRKKIPTYLGETISHLVKLIKRNMKLSI